MSPGHKELYAFNEENAKLYITVPRCDKTISLGILCAETNNVENSVIRLAPHELHHEM